MKRIIALVLTALLLTAAGCSKTPPVVETEPPTEAPTRPVVEVPVETQPQLRKYEGISLHYWSMLEETDPEAAVMHQAADYFAATTGADVEFHWLGGAEPTLVEALSSGTGVDIFEASGKAMGDTFAAYGLDLTQLAADARYEQNSWSALVSQIRERCGGLKAIAHRPRLYGMYYNQSGFDALGIEATPATWADYLSFCQMLKDSGYEALVIDDARANLILELHMERALGWEGLRETMVNGQWRKNEMAMTMIQNAISFGEMGYLVKGNPAVYPAGQNRLGQSNALLVAGSNVLCNEVEQSCLTDIRWGVFPYPGDGPGTGLLVDAQVLALSAACAQPQAAFDFVMLLTSGEFDQLRADVTEGIPADPANSSPITGATGCMASATAKAPKWFPADQNLLFSRLWNGFYKTGAYFANQLNGLAKNFANEKTVG